MIPIRILLTFFLPWSGFFIATAMAGEWPESLHTDRLVPWCIVPFDAKKRSPEQRAEMLKSLGLKRCAYDWRPSHIPEFEEEIRQYRAHGIEFFAFWGGHESAFELFEKYDLHPQIWRTLGSPSEGSQAQKVAAAADSMEDLAVRTAELQCSLGLYNHGGWGGEPRNLVAVCRELRRRGHSHTGIVYNWHHGHGHIDDWAESLALMKPYLICVNLNGMNANAEPKILTLGQGEHEAAMLDVLIQSGYDGPIGILDHQSHLDAEIALRNNLQGLNWLKKEWQKQGSGGPRPEPVGTEAGVLGSPPHPVSSPRWVEGPQGHGQALAGGAVFPGNHRWSKPPITVECQVRVDDAKSYNILVASDTKASANHWEIFTMKGNGQLTAYIPGATPDHIRSEKVISDKQWHHITMQYHVDRVKLWVDGQKVADTGISLKPRDEALPEGLGLARLVEGRLGLSGAIDTVRIRQGIHPPSSNRGKILAEWDFEKPENLSMLDRHLSVDRKPLEPEANPYWKHHINRDRVYDFYAKQAINRPQELKWFPGLDGGFHGHWGNQNDQTTWKDGRVAAMDHGSLIGGVFQGSGKAKYPRGVVVRLENNLNVAFDEETMQFVEAWQGPAVQWSDVRRGLMHGIPMGGTPVKLVTEKRVTEGSTYLGFYRSGKRIIFATQKDGRKRYFSAHGTAQQVVVSEAKLPQPGPAQWPDQIITQGSLGKGVPYAFDTLTLPYSNPWKALLFVSGLDFVSESRIAICTMHGDVWICDVSDSNLGTLTWKRFAAGLHQPLGLKVVDGIIHVMGRNQLTALHDLNADDEADFYQCVSQAHVASPGGHDFITGLQRDSSGHWYFASGNQGICRVSADGDNLKVLATGLRNPNGLGISPDGKVILSSVQEGTWTPASAVCDVSQGGHFGAGGPREGDRGYVAPMLYLPRGIDNSSGGQTYIDSSEWGPVQGQWLHYSSGFAKHFLVLREPVEGNSQAAAIVLPGSFLSGSHRGRFSPFDGQLYVAGAQGWGNYGTEDGSVQRVRYTGKDKDYPYPIDWEVRDNGILLAFDSTKQEIADVKKWFAQQWNYRYGPTYGSAEYSALEPERKGHDELQIRGVHKIPNANRWFIEIPQLQPVNQLHLHFDGEPRIEIFATIHRLGPPYTEFPGYQPIPKTLGTPQTVTASDMMNPSLLMTACTTCHQPGKQVVGPSFAEIRKRYSGNPEGIVNWAINPQNKNPQLPPMPSFEFLGKEKLRIIAEAILGATEQ